MEPAAPKLILVPTDFSAPSAQALRYAAALGDRFDAHLLVIFADPFTPSVDFTVTAAGLFEIPREELVEGTREQLQEFVETIVGTAVPYDVRVIVGGATSAILAQVRECGANLIVMGTHGRTGLRRLLLGSVTEEVMRLAPVPVLAVNESKHLAITPRVILGRPATTPEALAAVGYAGILADAEEARLVEVPVSADLIATAKREGADLIALGVTGERELAAALHVSPVLTVNRIAAHALAALPAARERALF